MNRDQRRLQLKGQRLEEERQKVRDTVVRLTVIIERLNGELAMLQREATTRSRSIAKHTLELKEANVKLDLLNKARS